MWQIFLKIGLGLISAACPVLIAWAVIHADKLDERRWVAEQRMLEAKRKAARARMLDTWDAERRARSCHLGSDEDEVDS